MGCGTGFFVAKGTNNDGIHNGPPSANVPANPGPPAPPRGMNVSLSNFTVNGNRGDGHNGNSTSGMPRGSSQAWFFGISLMNLDNITIHNVVVVNTPAYHVQLSNVGHVSVSGCVLQTHGFSTDGLHFNGPANDITISGCQISSGDDAIALNCPEGSSGNISRVSVSDCSFNAVSLMRLYTTNGGTKFSIDNVSVKNCNGIASEAAFLIGLISGSRPKSVDLLTISDSTFTAPAVLGIAENFGSIALKNVTLNPSRSTTVWVAPVSSIICAFLRPSPLYGGITSAGSSLYFEDCRISRSGDLSVAAVILENESSIGNVTFNGFGLQNNGSGHPIPFLVDMGSGSIQGMAFERLDSSNITAPITEGGFANVGAMSGTGVLATGWEFPDAVMADGVPYISAESGLPSIKFAGVVKPYTP